MFESNRQITEAIEALYEVTASLNRGDVLEHGQIREVLGLEPHEGRWDHIVNRVRRRLENERGIATWPKNTVGYELLTKERQLELPSWRTLKGMRQIRRGRKSLIALPEKGLSLHQRRARQFRIDAMKDTERAMRRSLKAQQEQLQPSPTLPRRQSVAEKTVALAAQA